MKYGYARVSTDGQSIDAQVSELTIGVSHHERMAVIRRTPALAFGPAEWLPADALDDTYFRLLPSGQSTVTAEEAAMLAAVFAEDGELPARPAGASTWSSKRDLT